MGDGSCEPPLHQLGGLGERYKLHEWGPGQSPRTFAFCNILGPQKSLQNGQLPFESGSTSESGGHVPPCPNVDPPLNNQIRTDWP